ncbi:R-spondin-3-like isoform X1 [Lates japonicus]|uniref:R-spondin-3-like isoform X1 n=1 Tax=Lates japonicus TaxID=270547 RepID=A0AAD3NA15_LATJO|nr:R-spondin-3-like isoform X1 [Lates japonicus]GLD67489.1 R-spondin-3-like isoform X1 [Lates japonicus]
MQLQLISFVLIILHCMDYTGCQQHSSSRHRQHKQISGVSSGCQQGGCLTCSDYNGCLSCKPRFFMHLERIGMKQIGVCMTSCPPGFYGTRSPERNTCTRASKKNDRRERRNRNNRKDKENQKGRRERKRERERERERDPGEREDSDNRNKTEHRHRRGHDTEPVSPQDGLVQ